LRGDIGGFGGGERDFKDLAGTIPPVAFVDKTQRAHIIFVRRDASARRAGFAGGRNIQRDKRPAFVFGDILRGQLVELLDHIENVRM
jgi:hypothetical protein